VIPAPRRMVPVKARSPLDKETAVKLFKSLSGKLPPLQVVCRQACEIRTRPDARQDWGFITQLPSAEAPSRRTRPLEYQKPRA
jgi:hypothetical protein